jgi:hypothetical protein
VGSTSSPLRYAPYGELSGLLSIVVDGSPAEGTVLCLSHWPHIGSPPEFAADLSAQMALLYLVAFDCHGPAEIVSNNHFDQDGLVGIYALVAPEDALARRDLLVEVARAGDFACTSSREAALVSMVLSAFADPDRSPLSELPTDYDARTAALYAELLGRLPEVCDKPELYRELWAEENATFEASKALVASGAVTIEEVPDVDLAVVTVPERAPNSGGHRFGGMWVSGLHPMAVHNATERGTILTVRGRCYELAYRYESWVQFRTRTVRRRVDLAPLAERFNAAEAAAKSSGTSCVWVAEPASALTPRLAPARGAESSLAPTLVRTTVEHHLRNAQPAWDPYRLAG